MRSILRPLLTAFAMAAVSCSSLAQQVYRWVDKEGRVHYTQQAPARDAAKSVEQRKIGGSVVEGAMPFALAQAVKNYPVVLYTAPSCKEGCSEARALLAKRGVPFREVNVTDQESHQLLKKGTGDDKVPALTVGTLVQKGFEPGAFNDALDSAGYPRSAVVSSKPPAPLAPQVKPAPTAPSEGEQAGTK